MSHSANAWRHNGKPNCQNYCEHNTQMQKSLQESANFYRSLAMVVGETREHFTGRPQNKSVSLGFSGRYPIRFALLWHDIPTGHSWIFFLRAGIEDSVLGYPMVQSQAEFPISHHPKPGPDRFQVRSFQVSLFWGQPVLSLRCDALFAICIGCQVPIFLIGEMKNENFENNWFLEILRSPKLRINNENRINSIFSCHCVAKNVKWWIKDLYFIFIWFIAWFG
jgi:hypothetical protein